MSCLLAYLGPATSLRALLLDTPHNLFRQARHDVDAERENLGSAEGFAFGWHAADASPHRYHRRLPIAQDGNLPDLATALWSEIWIAATGAVASTAVDRGGQLNLQRDKELLFLHTGPVSDFRTRLRPLIRDYLAPELEAEVVDGTLGEYLFALFRSLLDEQMETTMAAALATYYALLDDWMAHSSGRFELVASNGGQLCVARHAVNSVSAPLFYTTDDDNFPDAQVVASEPLTDTDFWHLVPEDSVLVLDPEQPPELVPLGESPED